LQEILKQRQYEPVPLEKQVLILYAGTNGFADAVPLDRMNAWQTDLLRFFETSYAEVEHSIATEKRITPENEVKVKEAMALFAASWK
jgi:F-type H+-transporting ATPase subunit alpha